MPEDERALHERRSPARSGDDALAPRHAFFTALADSLGVGVATVSTDRRQSWVNPAFVRMVGWPAERLLGAEPPFVYWPPEELERITAAFQLTVAGHAPPEGFELRFMRRDGARFDVLVSVGTLEVAGAPAGWVASVVDITARRRAESRARLQAQMLDAVGQAVIATDVAGGIIYVNREAERLYGWTREEVLGRNVNEVTVPPDVTGASDILARLTQGESWTGEYEVRRRDGTRFQAHVALRPIVGREREVLGVIGISYDISDRLAAEETRRDEARLVDTIQHVGRSLASELDLRKVVQAVTDAATTLTGARFGAFFYNAPDDAGGYQLFTVSGISREAFSGFPMPKNPPDDPDTVERGAFRCDDVTIDPCYAHMEPFQGSAGDLVVRSYLAVPVVSRTGDVLGGLFFGHDLPAVFHDREQRLAVGIAAWAAVAIDNARLYEAEQRARVAAEAGNKAKADFLAVVSHELRTPLNAMLGYTDLLLNGVPEQLPDRARIKVERIRLSARHLLQLIEEVLSFSRLEAGEETVELETVDPALVVGEVQALMEPLALAKGLTLDCRVPAGSYSLETDPRKLRQILLNLTANAIKFTEQGRVAIDFQEVGDVATASVPGDEGFAGAPGAAGAAGPSFLFHVRDTGRGIAPEHLERIFDAFWQVQGGSTRTQGGTGLGLSVTRRLARLLGGDVTVQSTPGEGSTFTVRLPRNPPPPDPAAAEATV